MNQSLTEFHSAELHTCFLYSFSFTYMYKLNVYSEIPAVSVRGLVGDKNQM